MSRIISCVSLSGNHINVLSTENEWSFARDFAMVKKSFYFYITVLRKWNTDESQSADFRVMFEVLAIYWVN